MLFKKLFTAMCVLTMTACASLTPPSTPPPLQASLRQPCPDLPPLTDGIGATALRWMTGTARMYRECQAAQARGVEAVVP